MQVAPDGTIWVAYNGTNKIGALDPETMHVRYYEVPNEESRIRRLGLTSDGMVWYGNSTRGRIGRLNPETGEIREWPSPSGPDSHPYAFTVVDDVIWYNESGMRPDALVRFDPETEQFQSWAIPSGVGIVREFLGDGGRQPADSPDQLEPHRPGGNKRLNYCRHGGRGFAAPALTISY